MRVEMDTARRRMRVSKVSGTDGKGRIALELPLGTKPFFDYCAVQDAISEDPDNLAALLGFSRSLISAALFGVADSSVAYPSAMEALRRVPK